ncbi:MAG: nicotinate phosphoribosyltransferase [Candidatus Nomurabacteria bacterium]|jgi:nicotinate phosphoribosyltransferase|nr:nicotinate phosphoribosyltransferase [Candidatus Nomurabacteria bacterium]
MLGSLFDTDLYKLTMGQFVNQFYPRAQVDYTLRFRTDVKFDKEVLQALQQNLQSMQRLTAPASELNYLKKRCGHYLNDPYLIFLKGCSFDLGDIHAWTDHDDKLHCEIVDVPWYKGIYWEVPLMATIAESYFETIAPLSQAQLDAAGEKACRKAEQMRQIGAPFIEMGTRRRRSYAVQDAVMRGLIEGGKEVFLGTSNVHFANKYDIAAHGTMAHELFSAVAAMHGVEKANNTVLGRWAELYHGHLGIALPDTFTSEFFRQSFDAFHAKLFDGVRQDSGDPFEFIDRFVEHYQRLGIDPRTKKLVFSDGINSMDLVDRIVEYCDGKAIPSFGIGTYLTNDFDDVQALNMVIKLTAARENIFQLKRAAIKLSDSPGKYSGDLAVVADYLRRIAA